MCDSNRCGGLPVGESEQRLGKRHNFGRRLIPRLGKRGRSVIFTHAHSLVTRKVPTGESQDISFHRTVELEFFGLDQKGKKIKVGCGKRAKRLLGVCWTSCKLVQGSLCALLP